MQPYFFPYIGYYQLINAVDKFVVYDDVNFIARGYINRNFICDQNGNKQYINILLNKASRNKQIKEIEQNNALNWQPKLLKQITQVYKKAPHFSTVFPWIEEIINYSELNLSVFLFNSIQKICDFLQIDTHIIGSSVGYENRELDRADRLIDICKKEEATHYINSMGGKALYDKAFFRQHDIQLDFFKTDITAYKQFSNTFVPNLSIIDVMMFNSVEEIKLMLDKYKLI